MAEEVKCLTNRELQEDIAESLRAILVALEEFLHLYRINH